MPDMTENWPEWLQGSAAALILFAFILCATPIVPLLTPACALTGRAGASGRSLSAPLRVALSRACSSGTTASVRRPPTPGIRCGASNAFQS